ncbi:MAG: 3-oxoacyl-ACP synthase III family protein [Planctomycetota bacterium]
MKNGIDVGIASVGHCLPEQVVKNEFFTRFVETSDEWIRQRTGIEERRWIRDGERPSDLFVKAGQMALERAGLEPGDIDLIVLGTVSGDFMLPSTACIVQERMGCRNAAAFDVLAACTGFLYALGVGHQFITSGRYRNVLVMGGEALSRICDHYDRNSVVLFADGAGAAVLQPHDACGQGLIEDFTLSSNGSGWHYIYRPAGGGAVPMTPEVLNEGDYLVRIKGREVYRFAIAKMTELMEWAMKGQDPADLGMVFPHQMNARILETAASKLSIPRDKIFINIKKTGNTSAGSVPIGLSEAWAAGTLEKGKFLILAAFGAGLTWGAARVRW